MNNTTSAYEQNHKAFLRNLKSSGDAVWFVARWLWARGYTVTINPIELAPKHAAWQEFADSGDLLIRQGNELVRVEVKQRSFAFSGLGDWRYTDFFICAKHSFDRANPKPRYYFIVSQDFKAFGIIDTRDKARWGVCTRGDSRYNGVKQELYTCSPGDVTWIKVTDNDSSEHG